MRHPLTLAILLLAAASPHTPASAQTTPPPAQSVTPATPAPQPAPKPQPDPDWAALNRYRAANAALTPPTPGEKRVVFMGDSITDGWGRWAAGSTFFPGKPYVNRGISGQTTPQMLVRFRQDVLDLHPAVVVILAGTNDIAGNTGPSTPEMIEGNLTSMAELARANGIRVVLASITPAYNYPWKPAVFPTEEIRAINQWMSTYCAAHNCVFLDYFTALADPKGAMLPGYSSDGVHPLAKGYAVMAPLAEQAIAQAEDLKP